MYIYIYIFSLFNLLENTLNNECNVNGKFYVVKCRYYINH